MEGDGFRGYGTLALYPDHAWVHSFHLKRRRPYLIKSANCFTPRAEKRGKDFVDLGMRDNNGANTEYAAQYIKILESGKGEVVYYVFPSSGVEPLLFVKRYSVPQERSRSQIGVIPIARWGWKKCFFLVAAWKNISPSSRLSSPGISNSYTSYSMATILLTRCPDFNPILLATTFKVAR
ncbi:hypothetical protein BDDG_11732 [Blastomyces dermatitidis ATCC 18188]|uniref:Uncharacterized protein n=1 Tax=Ajellomyces dermatitidis (strain ATCC 18188 / CBS 674.68) TaxID=653446 RepID=A0A0J9EL14_AJEDA|nr:hypothetical protein BDDG_11732 [Blastomyces dermatitidis ATCC 18188]